MARASIPIPCHFARIRSERQLRPSRLGRSSIDCFALERETFLGRADGQVKLHGIRIETAEIEAVLVEQPGVTRAAVVLREDTPGAPRLVAYLVTPAVDVTALRARLSEVLPRQLIPSAFVEVDALPRTASDKLDVASIGNVKIATGVVGIAGLLWAGLGWVDALRDAIRTMWHHDTDAGNIAVKKLNDILVLAGLGSLLLLSTLVTGGASSADG